MSPKMRAKRPASGDGEIRIRVPGGGTDTEETPASAESEALEEALSQLPQGSVAKLYRLEEDGTKAFVGQTAPEAMTEERIARAGPGKYRVIYWGPLKDHPGKRGYVAGRTVVISAGARGLTGAVTNPDGTPATATTMDALMQSQIVGMIEAMGKQRQIELSLMERLVNRPEAPRTEWGPILAVLAPVVGSIVTSMLSRKDPVELAAEIQKLTAVTERTTPLDQLRGLIGLVKDLMPPGEGGREAAPWWEGPLERIATAVVSGAPGGVAPGAGHAPPTMENPPTLGGPNVPALPEGEPMGLVERIIGQHGAQIAAWAQQGRDPTWAAETILYEIPPGLHGQVATRLQTEPGLINAIIAIQPALAPYR